MAVDERDDWHFERISRSALRQLSQKGCDLYLPFVGYFKEKPNVTASNSMKSKSVTFPKLQRQAGSRKNAKNNKATLTLKRTTTKERISTQVKTKDDPAFKNMDPKFMKQDEKKKGYSKAPKNVRQKSAKNEKKSYPTNETASKSLNYYKGLQIDRDFLRKLSDIGDDEIVIRVADFARHTYQDDILYEDFTLPDMSFVELNNSKIVVEVPDCMPVDQNVIPPSEEVDDTNQPIIEEPDSDDDEPIIIDVKKSDSNLVQENAPQNMIVPLNRPQRKIKRIGKTVKTTVGNLQDMVANTDTMPSIPIVRQDQMISRVVDLNGMVYEEHTGVVTEEHIDPSKLTKNQIKELEKQGFILRNISDAEKNALFLC